MKPKSRLTIFFLIIFFLNLTSNNKYDSEGLSKISRSKVNSTVTESINFQVIEDTDYSTKPHKEREIKIVERYLRDSREYMYASYQNASLVTTAYIQDNGWRHLWQIATDAQFSYIWHYDLRNYYVVASNVSAMKGSPPVFATYSFSTGKLLISNNEQKPLLIEAHGHQLIGMIGYHVGHSIPKAVTTWDTTAIRDMPDTNKMFYHGILSYASPTENVQKIGVYSESNCILRETRLYFEDDSKTGRSIEADINSSKPIRMILEFEGFERECPTEILRLLYSKSKHRFLIPKKSKHFRIFN